MDIPLFILLLAFCIPIVVFCILAAAHVYHVVAFGAFDRLNLLAGVLFIGTSAALLIFTAVYLLSVDWSATFSVPLPSLSLPELL